LEGRILEDRILSENEFEDFVIDMRIKLDEYNVKQRMFREMSFEWLMMRLGDEYKELLEAIHDLIADPSLENRKAVQRECADVANFAGFIHVNSKDKEK